MTDLLMPSLLSPLYASPAMRAIMSDRARLQRMLDVEVILARAEVAVGLITPTTLGHITDACRADLYDMEALGQAAAVAGNLAIPMVDALTAEVAKRDPVAAGFVHWGATSQDIIDTALVLELRVAIDALLDDVDRAIRGFLALAGRHRRTLAVARTMLQHALPMPFGLKLAGYAAALGRSRDRLIRVRKDALALQFGGAAGTLAALGDRGMSIAERMAALLDLPLPDAPWHSHRDRLGEVASAFAILAGTCGKIARDTALMMQVEVGEAYEPRKIGGGGSSTLPHKRNPVAATAALAAASLAPNLAASIFAAQVQEHERAIGAWQSEWITFPALALVTSGALAAIADIAEGLEIDVERVRDNLELSGGQIMAEAVTFALAPKLGRPAAHRLIQELTQQAVKSRRPLKDVVFADARVKAHLSTGEIGQLFLPSTYQGSAQLMIDRLVASAHSRVRRPESRTPEARPPTAAPTQPSAQPSAPAPATPPEPKPARPATPPLHLPKAEQLRTDTFRFNLFKSSAPKPEPPAEPPKVELPKATMLHVPEAPTPEPAATTDPPPPQAAPNPAATDADKPGALMDVLSRAEAEAQSPDKPKP